MQKRLKYLIRLVFSDQTTRNLFFFLVLNLCFAFVELTYGLWTNSLGLISDAFHMFFDCSALLLGLAASIVAKWKANEKFTYGFARAEVLAGMANGLFLLFIALFIMKEAIERTFEPPEVHHERLFVISVLGFLVNLVGIFVFQHGGQTHKGCSHSHSHTQTHTHTHTSHVDSHKDHNHHHHHHNNNNNNNNNNHHHHPKPNNHSHLGQQHNSHQKQYYEHNHNHTHVFQEQNQQTHHDHNQYFYNQHQNTYSSQPSLPVPGPGGYSLEMNPMSTNNNNHFYDPYTNYVDQTKDTDLLMEASHHKHDKNHHRGQIIQSVFLHIVADTLGSVGVIISAVLMNQFGWMIADPICSLFIAILISVSVFPLLRDSVYILMQRIPVEIEQQLPECLNKLLCLKGVLQVPEIHMWTLKSDTYVGSIKLIVSHDASHDYILSSCKNIFLQIGVDKMNIQIDQEKS